MNYLAHLYFADSDDEHRLGNLAGDWVKGRLENQPLPQRVLEGVRRHRFIDSYADHHPSARAARESLGRDRRRAAGIILDMVNDHLLVRHWSEYASTPLPDFLTSTYASLERTRHLWPDNARHVLHRIVTDDWLSRYGELETIDFALQRIAARLSRDPGLTGTLNLIHQQRPALEDHFHALMADLRAELQPR